MYAISPEIVPVIMTAKSSDGGSPPPSRSPPAASGAAGSSTRLSPPPPSSATWGMDKHAIPALPRRNDPSPLKRGDLPPSSQTKSDMIDTRVAPTTQPASDEHSPVLPRVANTADRRDLEALTSSIEGFRWPYPAEREQSRSLAPPPMPRSPMSASTPSGRRGHAPRQQSLRRVALQASLNAGGSGGGHAQLGLPPSGSDRRAATGSSLARSSFLGRLFSFGNSGDGNKEAEEEYRRSSGSGLPISAPPVQEDGSAGGTGKLQRRRGSCLAGIRAITLLELILPLMILGGIIPAWVISTNLYNHHAHLRNEAQQQQPKTSTNAIYVLIQVAFSLATVIDILIFERMLFIARAEHLRFIYGTVAENEGEEADIYPSSADYARREHDVAGNSVPLSARWFAIAPWNRPPLPTYAQTMRGHEGGRGTGDVEDGVVAMRAANPPPAYGNHRSSALLLNTP